MKKFRIFMAASFVAAAVFSTAVLSDAIAADTGAKAAKTVTSDSPSSTVKKFADAMCNLDFDEAKKYCDKDNQKIVDSAAVILKTLPADTPKEVMDEMKKILKDSFSFTVKSEKITGDKAIVTIHSKTNGKMEKSDLTLKKVNGKWVICN